MYQANKSMYQSNVPIKHTHHIYPANVPIKYTHHIYPANVPIKCTLQVYPGNVPCKIHHNVVSIQVTHTNIKYHDSNIILWKSLLSMKCKFNTHEIY